MHRVLPTGIFIRFLTLRSEPETTRLGTSLCGCADLSSRAQTTGRKSQSTQTRKAKSSKGGTKGVGIKESLVNISKSTSSTSPGFPREDKEYNRSQQAQRVPKGPTKHPQTKALPTIPAPTLAWRSVRRVAVASQLNMSATGSPRPLRRTSMRTRRSVKMTKAVCSHHKHPPGANQNSSFRIAANVWGLKDQMNRRILKHCF